MIKNSKKITITIATLTSCIALSTSVFATTNFTDTENHWGKEYIQKAVNEKIVSGYSDNTFRPDKTVTRAEFCTLLTKVLKIEDNNKEEVIFQDIEGTWAEKKIEALVNKNIIDKSEYQEYKANENITRLELVNMILKVIDIEKNTLEKGYLVNILDSNNESLIDVFKDKNLDLKNSNVTRAEAIKALYDMLDTLEKVKDKDVIESEKKIEKIIESSKIIEMKEERYSTNASINTLELIPLDQVIKNEDKFLGVKPMGALKMSLPSEKFEFKEVEFDGEKYIYVYNDELIDKDFRNGVAISEDKITDSFIRMGGYKSDLIDTEQTYRPYYSVKKSVIQEAEYLGFRRPAKYYFEKVKNEGESILIIFENPFKKIK